MEEHKQTEAPRDRAILVGLSSPRLDKRENADEFITRLDELITKADKLADSIAQELKNKLG